MFDQDIVSVFVFIDSGIVGGLLGTMCSGLLVSMKGEHKGKIRRNNQWAGFWRLFGFAVIEAVFIWFFFALLSPFMESFLREILIYNLGIVSFVVGLFFIWFVYSFDFDFKTQWKWIFPIVCFAISVLNWVLVNFVL